MDRKLPPLEKIAEAYSVIADNRIEQIDENTYIITSSNREKTYKVVFQNNRYRSNDSATKFQRYAGYPILAVLMYKSELPVNNEYIGYFSNIDWNAINKKYKRDYAEALDAALAEKNISAPILDKIKAEIKSCYDIFLKLDIIV